MYPIQKSQLVELVAGVANANQTTYSFQDQPQLRDVIIDGISCYNVLDISSSPTGNPLISVATMRQAYLTLFIGTKGDKTSLGQYVYQLPLIELHSSQTGVVSPFTRRNFKWPPGTIVDWSKSKIELSEPIGNTIQQSFLFNVLYHFDNAGIIQKQMKK